MGAPARSLDFSSVFLCVLCGKGFDFVPCFIRGEILLLLLIKKKREPLLLAPALRMSKSKRLNVTVRKSPEDPGS